ncbi:rhomboid family intramembrane serine protease [Modestobacter sp. Leaf380]|uniref:rhomboid family intramembrane serine protease n=1 Tax=Modestobacter sp. Leaf380 TaxID=1736356 RepID=UPI0006FC03B4|nr:rhomboid family intramembrane serine protease [Modestobacter sp. Leaf380]KQS66866.1 protease [Modestobacter sp. Leaf380]
MHPASVGFQCPEEIADARRTVRQPKRSTGLRVAGRRWGVVTVVLIALNVLVAVATAVSAISVGVSPLTSFSSPLQTELLTAPVLVDDGQWWRVVTSAFTHASLVHLALNMFALLLFGSELEKQFGKARYLTVYLVAALGGAASLQLFGAYFGGVVGASGAIYGLLGAFGVVLLKQKQDLRGLLTLLAINLVISFLPGVSLLGHLGGLVAGAATAAVLVYAGRRRTLAVGGVALVVAVLLVLTFGGLR